MKQLLLAAVILTALAACSHRTETVSPGATDQTTPAGPAESGSGTGR